LDEEGDAEDDDMRQRLGPSLETMDALLLLLLAMRRRGKKGAEKMKRVVGGGQAETGSF